MKRMTRSPARSSAGWVAAWLVGVALALALASPACSTATTAAPSGCSLNSDCAANLVCAFGKCRVQCMAASDCPVQPGSSCIDDGRYPVCQSPDEKNTPCTRLADCPTPLACASDYRCRNLCESDADCNVLGITGRVCAKDKNGVEYCADPGESANGVLITLPPPGAQTSIPVMEPEGGTSAIVAALPQGDLIATSVGQEGGTVGADGVTVTIPPNALTSAVTITISLSAQAGPDGTIGQVFEIGPTGTMFAEPITIAFDYTDSELAGLAPSDFAVETISANSALPWTPLSQIVVDVYAHTIAGQTTHLSPYALVQQQVGGGTLPSDAGAVVTADSGGPVVGADASETLPAADGGPVGAGDSATIPAFDSSVVVGVPEAAP
jgi:hypothetical protein